MVSASEGVGGAVKSCDGGGTRLPFPIPTEMMLISESPGASRKHAALTPGSKLTSPHGSSAVSVAAGVEGHDFCLKSKRGTLDHGKDHCPSQPSPSPYPPPLCKPLKTYTRC